MRKIHKATLRITEKQVIELPEGSIILSLKVQNNLPVLWFEFKEESGKDLVGRNINMYGTGNSLPDNPGKYIGVAQVQGQWGELVWHYYESD
jgi:hypothetical protein